MFLSSSALFGNLGANDAFFSAWRSLRCPVRYGNSGGFAVIRQIRLFLYFLIGLLLGGLFSLAHAETIPATISNTHLWSAPSWLYVGDKSWEDAKSFIKTYLVGTSEHVFTPDSEPASSISLQVTYKLSNGQSQNSFFSLTRGAAMYSCPSGQNWSVFGSVCIRADCVSEQVRGSDGVCMCPAGKELADGVCKTACPSGFHRRVPDDGQCEKDCIGEQFQETSGKCACAIGNTNQVISFTGAMTSQGCNNGCLYQLGSVAVGFGGGSPTQTSYSWGRKSGGICGANTTLTPAPALINKPTLPPSDTSGTGSDGSSPDPKNTADNNKDPMACGAAGGSWGTYNGVGKCLSASPSSPISTTKPSTSTTTNSDGTSSTTTGQTTTTCDGQSCTTQTTSQTTVSGPGGSSTSTTNSTGAGTGAGTGTGTGEGEGDGQDKGDCTLEPNAPYCKEGVLKEKGSFNDGPQNAELDAVKGRLRAKFAEIKAAAMGMLEAGGSGGGGSLPCFQPVAVLGQNFNVCFTQYSEKLAPIGGYVIFAASLLAVFIVLRR